MSELSDDNHLNARIKVVGVGGGGGNAVNTMIAAGLHGVDFISLRWPAYILGFIQNDANVMARELKLARATPEAVWSSNWEARDALFSGQFHLAHDRFQQSAQAALRENFPEFAAQWTMGDAEAHAVETSCETDSPDARILAFKDAMSFSLING